jgi:hypothetical protein
VRWLIASAFADRRTAWCPVSCKYSTAFGVLPLRV